MIRYYDVDIAGLNRRLPLYLIDEDTCGAVFVAFNDIELTIKAAEELLKQVPEFDVILTEEVQGIPLAFEMSRQAGMSRYIVARKQAKVPMDDVVAIRVESPDGEDVRKLYLTKDDAEYLCGKRVLLVDDYVLHGSTIFALTELTNANGGYVVGSAAILMQQDASVFEGLVTLGMLPIFHVDGVVKDLNELKD